MRAGNLFPADVPKQGVNVHRKISERNFARTGKLRFPVKNRV